MQWNPYNDNMLATCSEDGSISLWEIPENGPLVNMESEHALVTLKYHQKRGLQISWHPISSNVLTSVSQEPKICIWNLDDGVCKVELEVTSEIWNVAWNEKGRATCSQLMFDTWM